MVSNLCISDVGDGLYKHPPGRTKKKNWDEPKKKEIREKEIARNAHFDVTYLIFFARSLRSLAIF